MTDLIHRLEDALGDIELAPARLPAALRTRLHLALTQAVESLEPLAEQVREADGGANSRSPLGLARAVQQRLKGVGPELLDEAKRR